MNTWLERLLSILVWFGICSFFFGTLLTVVVNHWLVPFCLGGIFVPFFAFFFFQIWAMLTGWGLWTG